ncbi:MAG: hypothetical protein RL326_1678 [Pseudomonadota bacterium]|jgi:hypothetical protein
MRLERFLAVLTIMCGFSHNASAITPFRARAKLSSAQMTAHVRTPAKLGASFQPISIELKNVRGLGHVRVVLNKRKLPSAEACFVRASGRCERDLKVAFLLRGTASIRGSARQVTTVPAAASVIDGRARIQFQSPRHGATGHRQRVYSIHWKLGARNDTSVHVASKPHSVMHGKVCATAHNSEMAPRALAAKVVASGAESYRVVTISTDADAEWYAKFGENSNVEIAAIINAAEAIYDKYLGIRFGIVRQHVYTGASPYVMTDPSNLLSAFAKNPENVANLAFSPLTFNEDVDLKHLFTGKELDGQTVGLSYVGAVCWAPASAYGLTQGVGRDLTVGIFAHEVGHSLGAQHDEADFGSVMSPIVNTNGYFSATSMSQINKHLAVMGKCVQEEMLRPNLVNAKLTLKRKRSADGRVLKFYGRLVSAGTKPIAGEIVKLTINTKTVLVMTDSEGVFSYVLKTRKIKAKRLTVFAQTVNSETSIPGALRVPVRI